MLVHFRQYICLETSISTFCLPLLFILSNTRWELFSHGSKAQGSSHFTQLNLIDKDKRIQVQLQVQVQRKNREPFKLLTMTINENAATITESLFIFASLA